VVGIIDRVLPLSHNNLQISKNKLVWRNKAHVELNCNVIYQVSPEIRELEVEVLCHHQYETQWFSSAPFRQWYVTFSTIRFFSV